jgi:hypothetical protein
MGQVYLDEGLSSITDARLGRLGDDVVDARSIVRHSTSDHHHLAVATLLNRVLVTYNRTDFELLHHAWRDWFDRFGQPPLAAHGGILVVPQPPALIPDLAADLIHSLVNDPATGPLANRLFVWSIGEGWEEKLPAPPSPPQANTARRPGLPTPPEVAGYLRRANDVDQP